MAAYAAALILLALWFARRASRSTSDYFAGGRSLPWWAAGTSMIAASFASDTPLLVTGYVREKGVWGNWSWWCLGISTVLSTFFFSRLWHRSGVLTETALSEARYTGPNAAALRGFKAVFWGLIYASFAAGAGAILGLSKVTGVALGWDKTSAILLCAVLAAVYVIASGLWGVVATDVFQFVAAVLGSVATAWFAVRAAGGLPTVLEAAGSKADLLPSLSVPGDPGGFWQSPLAWLLALLMVQWWAWKNADGGGVLVQRMAACRNEKHAVGATLWYAVGHNALRAWPWVLAALASLILFPDRNDNEPFDHEATYGLLVVKVLPAGIRGFVLAWFLAEFMTGVAQFANFGASLLVNDGWKRFLKPDATERQTLVAARWASLLVIACAVGTSFLTGSVRQGFETILQLTAGIGTVCIARWLWWRVNAMGEIAAIVAAVPTLLLAPWVERQLGIPDKCFPFRLLFMTGNGILVWLIAVLATPPEPMEHLVAFYRKVRPPRWGWGPVARQAGEVQAERWGEALLHWLLGTAGLYALLFGLGWTVLGQGLTALIPLLAGGGLLGWLAWRIARTP